jgi:hypothetical protein
MNQVPEMLSDNARILYMCCTYSSSILDTDQPIITKKITYNDIYIPFIEETLNVFLPSDT